MVGSFNAWGWALYRYTRKKMGRRVQKGKILIETTERINKIETDYPKEKSALQKY